LQNGRFDDEAEEKEAYKLTDLEKAKQALAVLESMDYKNGSVSNAIKSVRGVIWFLEQNEGGNQ